MTADDLAAALRNCATGLCPLEAGVALLISNGTFLHRDDFTSRFIEHGTSDGTPMAAIDWDAAITALHSRRTALLRRGTPHPPAVGQPRRRHPRRPPRRRHRPRRRQHRPAAHSNLARVREATQERADEDEDPPQAILPDRLKIVHVMPCAQGRGPAIRPLVHVMRPGTESPIASGTASSAKVREMLSQGYQSCLDCARMTNFPLTLRNAYYRSHGTTPDEGQSHHSDPIFTILSMFPPSR